MSETDRTAGHAREQRQTCLPVLRAWRLEAPRGSLRPTVCGSRGRGTDDHKPQSSKPHAFTLSVLDVPSPNRLQGLESGVTVPCSSRRPQRTTLSSPSRCFQRLTTSPDLWPFLHLHADLRPPSCKTPGDGVWALGEPGPPPSQDSSWNRLLHPVLVPGLGQGLLGALSPPHQVGLWLRGGSEPGRLSFLLDQNTLQTDRRWAA